jgi:hypothetical protein
MADLAGMQCEVCRVGAPTLTETEISGFAPEVPDWKVA